MSQLKGTITGSLFSKFTPETRSWQGKDYTTQEFIVQVTDEWDNARHLQFELSGKATGALDDIEDGTTISVSYNLTGSLSAKTGKAYNKLKAWKVEVVENEGYAAAEDDEAGEMSDDEVPF